LIKTHAAPFPHPACSTGAVSRVKLRIRFVVRKKIARRKTRFLPCSRRPRRRAGLARPATRTLFDMHFYMIQRTGADYL
jgi:hypothetical protein